MARRPDGPAYRSALDEETLTAELHALGVRPGTALLTHSSLRVLGPVRGGSRAVVRALRAALGPAGTLVVPTFTPENSDTSPVYQRRVRGLTPAQVAELRGRMPPFDPARTPARSTGRLAEEVRTHPEALRSGHPQTSFAAIGPLARHLVRGHAPRCHLGEDSPLARLYDVGAEVLLLGVGFDSCTAFHLAEYRVPERPLREYRCVIRDQGARTWWSYTDVALDDSDFAAVGAAFERSGALVRTARVGRATARLFALRAAVDHAVGWLPVHRPVHRPGPGRG
ncbi:aminoglycoside N(3)-acetyltransferase [Streptomyces sp. NPDC059010]|uniref:aminoglycoside N(3)-acetyltransferase n=1 Tax=Streptomyces sp. NPDC059010 TaxID=3346695 RepID=UPI0036888B9F